MTTLSDRTIGLLVEHGDTNMLSRSDLETMLLQANLAQYDPPGFARTKRELLLRHLREAKSRADRGDGPPPGPAQLHPLAAHSWRRGEHPTS